MILTNEQIRTIHGDNMSRVSLKALWDALPKEVKLIFVIRQN